MDHGAKHAIAKDVIGMLRLTGSIPEGADARVTQLSPEIVVPPKLADRLVMVQCEGRRWLEQVEYLARWHSRERDGILLRSQAVTSIRAWRTMPLRVSIVVHKSDGFPKDIPRIHHVQGHFYSGITPQFTLLWKIKLEDAVRLKSAAVLTLAPYMDHTWEGLVEAAAVIHQSGDSELVTQFVIHCESVYTKEEIGRIVVVFERQTLEIAKGTWLGKDLIKIGRKEGLAKGEERGFAKGIEKGEAGAARRVIRLIQSHIARHYPSLSSHPGIKRIRTMDQAEAILGKLLEGGMSRAAVAALLDAC